jgi:hypothetical protein
LLRVAVREALCEAAASPLFQVRKWSVLRAWDLRIAKRSSMLCAIIAVARKLAGILHRMWVSEADFKVGFGTKVTQRLRLKPVQQLLHGSRGTSVGIASSMLRTKLKIRARGERPWQGRETGNVRYLLPASVPHDESARLLGLPC